MPVTDVRRERHAAGAPTDPTSPRRFVTVWAAAVTVVLGLLSTGTTALTIALWSTDPAYTQTNPVVDLAFFALGGILITVGLASQIRSRQVAGCSRRSSRCSLWRWQGCSEAASNRSSAQCCCSWRRRLWSCCIRRAGSCLPRGEW